MITVVMVEDPLLAELLTESLRSQSDIQAFDYRDCGTRALQEIDPREL